MVASSSSLTLLKSLYLYLTALGSALSASSGKIRGTVEANESVSSLITGSFMAAASISQYFVFYVCTGNTESFVKDAVRGCGAADYFALPVSRIVVGNVVIGSLTGTLDILGNDPYYALSLMGHHTFSSVVGGYKHP